MTTTAPAGDTFQPGGSRRLAPFMITKQHRRFVEFANTVRRSRYIGACYGSPGIGKTLSARTYAAADDWDRWSKSRHMRVATLPASLLACRTVMWTPHVLTTPRELEREVEFRCGGLTDDIESAFHPDYDPELMFDFDDARHTELFIVDEADRLKTQGLEQLRDYFDRNDIGLILIGMPGFERQLARYPQLYSRIGFAHQYRPLDPDDVPPVLALYWTELGLTFNPAHPADGEAALAITRITGGNFRLIERLLGQVGRLLSINQLDAITVDVVEAARETLVIGT
ncbi:MAG TPA: AAA family ATPase [Nakamurella sp.]|nr:AAA family ATPase [Nakamurella sp.]